jgi:hypothetical protein
MKKFISQVILFSSITIILLVIFLQISSLIVNAREFKNSETESNTLIIKEDRNYELLILGISHARNFSRHRNHELIEKITNKKIINIGQGGGACGLAEQLFYLDYFYKKNNSADTILFILSPPLFYSKTLPIASNTFLEESFNFDFLFSYLKAPGENKRERTIEYFRSKFSEEWLTKKPYSKTGETKELRSIDPKVVNEGFKSAYGDSLSETQFKKSCQIAEEIILLAQTKKSKILFIVPPALFGKWPGHNECIEFAKKMEQKYGCKYYDFSEAVITPAYYYDHHHLNTKGIVFFTKNFLRPILN